MKWSHAGDAFIWCRFVENIWVRILGVFVDPCSARHPQERVCGRAFSRAVYMGVSTVGSPEPSPASLCSAFIHIILRLVHHYKEAVMWSSRNERSSCLMTAA